MVSVAYCDNELDPKEEKILEKFATKRKLKFSLKNKKRLEKLTLDDAKESVNKCIKNIAKLQLSHEREYYLFVLLEQLQKIAEADETFHEKEKELIKMVCELTGIKFSLSKNKPKDWTKSQQKVLNRGLSEKTIIHAPPGAGKTECVAEKVVRFFKEGANPQRILLISFTRNAVREMEDRIALKTFNDMYPFGLKILTLDKQAYLQNTKLYSDWSFPPSYESNLNDFLQLLKEDNFDLIENWENTQHLFIDEAQDIVGIRRDICLTLVDKASKDCGISVLGDPAQKIYGWDQKDQSKEWNDNNKISLMDAIDSNRKDLGFKQIELQHIHRTNDISLLKINEVMREDIILLGDDAGENEIENKAKNLDHLDTGDFKEIEDSTSNYLFLFRQNKEVGNACHRFETANRPFRVNTGSFNKFSKYFPIWIFNILDYFDKHDLKEMSSSDYKRMIQNLPVSTWSIFSNEELLWQRLLRNAGCGPSIISLEYLRESLASSEGNRPPIEFQNRYFGRSGPVLSTVHAAKGSEARHVLIDESGLAKDNFTSLEEAKVVFVALTRATDSVALTSSVGYFNRALNNYGEKVCNRHAKGVSNGRLTRLVRKYTLDPRRRATPIFGMEIGLNGDYDLLSIVSNRYSLSDVDDVQYLLSSGRLINADYECYAIKNRHNNYNIKLDFEGITYALGQFTSQVNDNILNFIKYQKTQPGIDSPSELRNLRIMDIATHVANQEELEGSEILQAYQNKGFWAYPIIYGSGPFHGKKIR